MASLSGYILLAIALVLNASANILLKAGAADISLVRTTGLVKGLAANPMLLIGLALFGLNVIFYTLALSRLPLSVAYPVMTAGGIAIITLASVLLFKESLSGLHVVGLSLVLAGIVILTTR